MTDFFKSRHQYNCKTKQILLINFFSEVTHKKHCKEILVEINVRFTLRQTFTNQRNSKTESTIHKYTREFPFRSNS